MIYELREKILYRHVIGRCDLFFVSSQCLLNSNQLEQIDKGNVGGIFMAQEIISICMATC